MASSETPFEIPGELFSGYDSINGTCKATAVDGTIREPETDSSTVVHIKVCSTAQQVANALSISGTASASYGAFSASVSSSYAHDLELTETSTVVVVSVVRKTSVERYRTTSLTATRPTARTIEDFYQTNGDVWVSSLTRGMQYWSLFIRNDSTREEHENTVASLKAEGGVGDFSGSVEVDSSLSKTLRSSASSWTHTQGQVGLPGVRLPGDIDGVIAFANSFNEQPESGASVLSFTTQGYEDVPGFPDPLVKALKRSRDLLSNPTRPTVASLQSRRLALQAQARTIAEVSDLYKAYGYLDPRLAEVAELVAGDLDSLTTAEADIKDDPFGTWTLPDTPSLAIGAPEVQVELDARQQVGGGGGMAFSAPLREAVLAKNACMRVLTPRGNGASLSHLQVGYEGAGGQFEWGQWAGDWAQTLQLSAKNRVNYLEIAWDGHIVRGMTVRTTQSQVTSAGNGNGYTLTRYPLAENERLVGFNGRCGELVDNLQPVVAVFSPATWPKQSHG